MYILPILSGTVFVNAKCASNVHCVDLFTLSQCWNILPKTPFLFHFPLFCTTCADPITFHFSSIIHSSFFYYYIPPNKIGRYSFCHRWARLLKRQLSINIHRLPTIKNKLPFSVSVCNKQTEVCRFRFPFATNRRKLPFFFSSVFQILYIYIYIYVDIQTYIDM